MRIQPIGNVLFYYQIIVKCKLKPQSTKAGELKVPVIFELNQKSKS